MDFIDIKDGISDFAHEKPVLFTVIILIVFLFLAGIVILMIQTSPREKTPYKSPDVFTQDASEMIPDPPDIEKEYYPSRITENQWSQKEVKQWFTYPDENSMAELEGANNKIVDDITGAAP